MLLFILLLFSNTLHAAQNQQPEDLFYQAFIHCKDGSDEKTSEYLRKIPDLQNLAEVFDMSEEKTILHYIAIHNCLTSFLWCQQWPADLLNKKDIFGKTPLMYALEHGHALLVHDLVMQNEIDLNIQDNEGRTVLHYAAAVKNGLHYFILCKSGANQEIEDFSGQKPEYPYPIPGSPVPCIEKTLTLYQKNNT